MSNPKCPSCSFEASAVRFSPDGEATCLECSYKSRYENFFKGSNALDLFGMELTKKLNNHNDKIITRMFHKLNDEDQEIIIELMQRMTEKKDHN